MLDHVADRIAGGAQLLAGIEFFGMLDEELANLSGHRQADIGIDVDLADTMLGSFGDHVFGNTLCAGDLAAVLVAFFNEFGQDRAGTVQDERCVGDQLVYRSSWDI